MRALVTGGSGFLGASLCAELLGRGRQVRVLDDLSRGSADRLEALDILDDVELITGSVCDPTAVRQATRGCAEVWHLAYINGTRHFYERPDAVLEVAIKGALHTIEAALESGVERYVLASSSETYNLPPTIPTPEEVPLVVPDVTNPRFSYGGGKIASELLALHLAARRGLPTVIFRPHNFIGPRMGFEHVIPEVVGRIVKLSDGLRLQQIDLPIQGDGSETRAFCDITDGACGAAIAGTSGESGGIYHVGTEQEVTIRRLIELVGEALGVQLNVLPGERLPGSTPRRCPDITRLRALGYTPRVTLEEAVRRTASWYAEHLQSRPD